MAEPGTPKFYREEASRLANLAEITHDHAARAELLDIAKLFQRLADRNSGSTADQSFEQNRLLCLIGAEDRGALGSAGDIVELQLGDVLCRIGHKSEYVWFPLSGMVSLTIPLEEDKTIQVAVVGREGVVGLSALLGGRASIHEAVVHLSGQALRINCAAFRKLLERDQSSMLALAQFSHDLFALVSQTAACNVRHLIPQRLAKLILLSHDRSDGGSMPLSQQLLATMLGVPRTSVSVAAQHLQLQGAIEYLHGRLTVTERTLLERLSCECYGAVRSRTGYAPTHNRRAFHCRADTVVQARSKA